VIFEFPDTLPGQAPGVFEEWTPVAGNLCACASESDSPADGMGYDAVVEINCGRPVPDNMKV
jgi:hypothetical protein